MARAGIWTTLAFSLAGALAWLAGRLWPHTNPLPISLLAAAVVLLGAGGLFRKPPVPARTTAPAPTPAVAPSQQRMG